MGAWPGPMPGGFPAAALPLVSPVQGGLKGNCDVLSSFVCVISSNKTFLHRFMSSQKHIHIMYTPIYPTFI